MKRVIAGRGWFWLVAASFWSALLVMPWIARGATLSEPTQVLTPKPKIPPPQIKLPPPTPPAPLSVKAPPPQVIVPGLQPGKVIEFTLAGGQAPIQIAIDAGANSQLFSLARRPDPRGKFGVGMSVKANSLASAEEFLGVRYAGVASLGQLANQIPLTVRATDAAGATVNVTMTVYPVVPQITVSQGDLNNVTAKQAITVGLSLDRLPPGVSVFPLGNRIFENLSVAETNCFFLTNGSAAGKTADLSGHVRFDIEGSFGVRSSASDLLRSCTFAMELEVRGFVAGAHRFFFKQGNIRLITPVQYTVNDTNALKSLFNFTPSTGSKDVLGGTFGVCAGTSLGVEAVNVGIIETGNDLAFRIRSGPIGTGCEWRSQPVNVAPGLRLVAMNWEAAKVGSKCCSGTFKNCEPPNIQHGAMWNDAIPMAESPSFGGFAFDNGGGDHTARRIDGSTSGKTQSDWGKSSILPMTVRLRCDPTLVNDHGITLRLNSVVLEGPAGRAFP